MIRHIIRTIWNDYRWHIVGACILLGAVSLLNGFTVVSLLPLAEMLQNGQTGDSAIARFFGSVLATINVGVSIRSLLILVACMFIAKALCSIAQEVLFHYVAMRMEIDRKDEIFQSLMRTDVAHLYGRNFGQLTNVIVNETRRVALLVEYLSRFAIGAVNASVYIVAVLLVDWKLTLLTATLTAVTYIVIRGLFKKARVMGYRIAGLNGVIQDLVHIGLFGYRNAKIYVVEKTLIGKLIEVMHRWKRLNLTMVTTESALKSFFEPMVVVVAVVVFFVYRIELAVFVTFTAALLRMNKEIREIQKTHYKIARNVGSLQMYREVLDDLRGHPYPKEDEGEAFARLDREVVFENVSYTYRSGPEAFTLGPVNLRVPRGSMVAFVGPSGSGKSTLIDLVAGLLVPDGGAIRADGRDLRELNLFTYRRRVGYVTQDIFLLNDTVLNNIIFWDDSISAEDARRACELAHAAEFIENLPDGYETVIGEHGARLSGGQKQRVSLARALARRPEILILDEATSSLDNESERRIQQAIEHLAGEITILVIAHRLSTVRNADYLYILEEGKVVEEGRYGELMEREGRFFQLHAAADDR